MSTNSDLITTDAILVDSAKQIFVTASNKAAQAAQKVLDLIASGASFDQISAAATVQRAAQRDAVAAESAYENALNKLLTDASTLPSGGDTITTDASSLDSAKVVFVAASNDAAEAAQNVQDLSAQGASFPVLSAAAATQRAAQRAAVAAAGTYNTALDKLYTDAAALV